MGVEQNRPELVKDTPASLFAVASFVDRFRVTKRFELRREETKKQLMRFLVDAIAPGYLPIYQQHFQSGAAGFIEIVLQPLKRSTRLLSHQRIESLVPSEQELMQAQEQAIDLARWYGAKNWDVRYRVVVSIYDDVQAPRTQYNGTYHSEGGLLVRRGEVEVEEPERELFPTLEPVYYSEAHAPSPYMFNSMFLTGNDLVANNYGAQPEQMLDTALSMLGQRRDVELEKARQLMLLEKEAARRRRGLVHPDQFVEYGFKCPYEIQWMTAASTEFKRAIQGVDRNRGHKIKHAVPTMLKMIATDPRNPVNGTGGFTFNKQETRNGGDALYHIGHYESSTGLVYSLHEPRKRVNILACRKY